jgi:mono/diheme cytochrome c family protein
MMRIRGGLVAGIVACGVVAVPLFTQRVASQDATDFDRDIQPIFQKHCYTCHAGASARGQLRLDVGSLALQGGVSGPALIPRDSRNSLLIHRLNGDGGQPRMPMGGALSADDIALVSRWIDMGANWPAPAGNAGVAVARHWAYVAPTRPPLPKVNDTAWATHAVDRFILARLEKEGLRPSPQASKETLIRRLSLDLIGLPPTVQEVDAFVSDPRPDAYERLVDRLLASPHYGERWARPWLDVARYADSNGYEKDKPRSIWPYRDWVINALNRNMPFDEFTIEQIAGDLEPNATIEQLVATGFLRNSMLNEEAGVDPEEANWTAQLDRATTVATTFLGSTIGCAQCHNHKFDPFTQKDFYQLVAFFNNAQFVQSRSPFARLAEPQLDLPSTEQARRRDEIAAISKQYEQQLSDDSVEAMRREARWEQTILDADRAWTVLQPTQLESSGGSTLAPSADGSVLVSGTNPAKDTYTIQGRAGTAPITGVRVEALPDPNLPQGGPGRDYYGNFVVATIDLEAAPTGTPIPVHVREVVSADPPPTDLDAGVRAVKRLWAVDATREKPRLPHEVVIIPDQPFNANFITVRIGQVSDFSGQGIGRFRVLVTTAADPKQIVTVPARIRTLLDIPVDKRTLPQGSQVLAQYRAVAPELRELREKLDDLDKQVRALKIPTTLVMSENRAIERPKTFIRNSGSYTAKGAEVESNVPAFLGAMSAEGPRNRLTLARWLVSKENPLTARVVVNRFWQTMFGRGLVETSEDFGTQGAVPSHAELLDWLAVEFMESGWDSKGLQRLIVTSNTYRQSSAVTKELLDRDPANVLLARGARFRVEAEMIRDIVLRASGLLSEKIGGPSVMPPQPDGVWEISFTTESDQWRTSDGDDRYRRGLYTFIRRVAPYPSLNVFDAPSHEFATARRSRTNTPLQALTTLNDPAFFEAAQSLARRTIAAGASDTARVTYAFRAVISRRPTQPELKTFQRSVAAERQYFRTHPGERQSIAGKNDPDAAVWTMISRALLNLDEAITHE